MVFLYERDEISQSLLEAKPLAPFAAVLRWNDVGYISENSVDSLTSLRVMRLLAERRKNPFIRGSVLAAPRPASMLSGEQLQLGDTLGEDSRVDLVPLRDRPVRQRGVQLLLASR